MNFGIYLPPKAESAKVPVIYWLSGKKNYSFIAAFALLCGLHIVYKTISCC